MTAAIAKTYHHGTHRSRSPEQTLAEVRPHLAVMGITRLADVTGLDCIGIPVVMAYRPNSRSLATSQGKGLSLACALTSAVMETIEAYHAEHVELPVRFDSYANLQRRAAVVDVAKLPRGQASVFHPDRELMWLEGEDLFTGTPTWVPYESVSLDNTLPRPPGHGAFAYSSTGLASGNHRDEAISHGLCEVVERDAIALWRLRSEAARHATRVELDTVDDAGCRAVLARFDAAEIDVAVWDLTTDVGLPAFACMITDRREDRQRAVYSAGGAGAHPTRAIALSRALTEAAQSRLTMITGSRDDQYRDEYDRLRRPETLARDRDEISTPGPRRRFTDTPDRTHPTSHADVKWALDRLRAIGITQVIAVDLTRAEWGIPVVRVVVPGLEDWARKMDLRLGARAAQQVRGTSC